MIRVRGVVLITLSINLLVVVGVLTSFVMQLANADNNDDNHKKSCHVSHHGNGKCSHKDETPFILPFP